MKEEEALLGWVHEVKGWVHLLEVLSKREREREEVTPDKLPNQRNELSSAQGQGDEMKVLSPLVTQEILFQQAYSYHYRQVAIVTKVVLVYPFIKV